MEEVQQVIRRAVKQVFSTETEPELSRPEARFGDYATNVALKLAGNLGKPPRDIATELADHLAHDDMFKSAEVAGPGFINLTLSDEALVKLGNAKPSQSLKDQVVVAEYSDPNPFKVLHAGHLYTSVVGDAVANLLAVAGAEVHRVNFGGDVGLHVGKMMWAAIDKLGGIDPDKFLAIGEADFLEWVTDAYVKGTEAYEIDSEAKKQIVELNKKIYQLFADKDTTSPLAKLYHAMRSWFYDVYFKSFYAAIGTSFEKYYPESQTAPLGLKTVQEQLAKGVYKKSDGAIIFDGEAHGLHTRVFITSEGLPTYEAKDVGLIMKKYEDYKFDLSVVITGNDIVEYMKVVLKSMEQYAPQLARATRHISHGIVKLQGGSKMSSRKGNILRAMDVLDAAAAANKEHSGNDNAAVVLAAVKYSFLKQRIGADIIYDPAESVSLQGNSGPYLQYAYARARSILAKANPEPAQANGLEPDERLLMRKITEFTEVTDKAVAELLPHHICTYLYELAQEFNRFYEKNRVIGDPREAARVWLVNKYADTLRAGLELLNIPVLEKM